MEVYEENANCEKSWELKKTENDDINNYVWKWFQYVRAGGINVSGPMIQDVALKFANTLGKMEFQASNGWLESFVKRHNIIFRKAFGAFNTAVEARAPILPTVCCDYPLSNIFNASEISLMFKALPDESLSGINEMLQREEMADQRISILVAASASGEKLPLLIIGNSLDFKDTDVEKLPVTWYANPKSCITSDIFREWLTKLNKKFLSENRRILLFVDNCPAHRIDLNFSNINVMFLPVSSAPFLQPMNQGVTKCLKINYRKQLLRTVISRYLDGEDINDIVMSVSAFDSLLWLVEAWDKIDPAMIISCFEKSNFPVSKSCPEPIKYDDDMSLSILMEQIRLVCNFPEIKDEEFITFDDFIPPFEIQANEEFHNNVSEEKLSGKSPNKPQKEGEQTEIMQHCPTTNEVICAMNKIKCFTVMYCPEMLTHVSVLEGAVNKLILNNKKTTRQSSMDFFFKRFSN